MELYMVVPNGLAEWEDMILYLSKEEAIEKSKKWPNTAVQIFTKTTDGYRPSYSYYLAGVIQHPKNPDAVRSDNLVSKDEKSSNEFSSISSSNEKLKSTDGQKII